MVKGAIKPQIIFSLALEKRQEIGMVYLTSISKTSKTHSNAHSYSKPVVQKIIDLDQWRL